VSAFILQLYRINRFLSCHKNNYSSSLRQIAPALLNKFCR